MTPRLDCRWNPRSRRSTLVTQGRETLVHSALTNRKTLKRPGRRVPSKWSVLPTTDLHPHSSDTCEPGGLGVSTGVPPNDTRPDPGTVTRTPSSSVPPKRLSWVTGIVAGSVLYCTGVVVLIRPSREETFRLAGTRSETPTVCPLLPGALSCPTVRDRDRRFSVVVPLYLLPVQDRILSRFRLGLCGPCSYVTEFLFVLPGKTC